VFTLLSFSSFGSIDLLNADFVRLLFLLWPFVGVLFISFRLFLDLPNVMLRLAFGYCFDSARIFSGLEDDLGTIELLVL
jgi:hypothetical protein